MNRVGVRIWDLPTRAFHWMLAALLIVCWITAGEIMLVHRVAGYGVITLVIFRIYWGFAGSDTARFRNFVRGPASVLSYARGLFTKAVSPAVGHNPLGGWSVMAMLALLVVQAGLGLFATDRKSLEAGPYAVTISYAAARQVRHLHDLAFNFLLLLAILHIAAIAYYYFYKKQDLVRPMITGDAAAAPPAAGSLRFSSTRRAVVALLVIALIVAVAVNLPSWR